MRTKWFEGFLWAEGLYRVFGPKLGEDTVDEKYDEACSFGELSDFDRGANDYTLLMRARKDETLL